MKYYLLQRLFISLYTYNTNKSIAEQLVTELQLQCKKLH